MVKSFELFYTKNDGSQIEELKKQKWHIDPGKSGKYIKFFIPFCDVNEENGATHVVKGSYEKLPEGVKSGMRFSDDYILETF